MDNDNQKEIENEVIENNNKTYTVEEILKIISENNNIPEEIKTLLKNIKGEEKVEQNNINYIDGLSLADIQNINEYARNQTENYTKSPFNMENIEHREYFEYFKNLALKEKEKEIKLIKFNESLHEKYGDMYESVEKAARDTFESMAFKDARDIISSRMHGNVEKLLSFYDNVFNEMVNKQKKVEDNLLSEDGNIIFPPKAINGGNFKTVNNKNTYDNFI